MPIQQVALFLTIAAHEGSSLMEIRDRLGMSSASSSRNLAALSKVHRLGKPGLDLVETKEDPYDRRRKILKLTAKGRQMATRTTDHWED